MRFYKRRRIPQIQKYFPEAHIEKINSWKILKENMGDCEIISNGGKIHEIGEDIASKESSKTRYHQKKKAMTKSCDIESKQNIQRLLDIVEIKKNSLMDLTRSDENSVNYSAIEKIKKWTF